MPPMDGLVTPKIRFSGVKIALLCDEQMLTILWVDKPDIKYSNMWDLAGGGRRESDETPFECVRRETIEELGIAIDSKSVIRCKAYQGVVNPQKNPILFSGES